jgi:predicted RNase H-like nuclease
MPNSTTKASAVTEEASASRPSIYYQKLERPRVTFMFTAIVASARAVTRLIDKLDAHPLRAGVARDDILDAMVCGYVARLDSKQLRALPEGGVEQNERGDAMQIWFPSA